MPSERLSTQILKELEFLRGALFLSLSRELWCGDEFGGCDQGRCVEVALSSKNKRILARMSCKRNQNNETMANCEPVCTPVVETPARLCTNKDDL